MEFSTSLYSLGIRNPRCCCFYCVGVDVLGLKLELGVTIDQSESLLKDTASSQEHKKNFSFILYFISNKIVNMLNRAFETQVGRFIWQECIKWFKPMAAADCQQCMAAEPVSHRHQCFGVDGMNLQRFHLLTFYLDAIQVAWKELVVEVMDTVHK